MLYLATTSGPKVRDAMTAGLLAQMVTHKGGSPPLPGVTFAIDNGRVKLIDGQPVTDPDWSADRWYAHLKRLRPERERCLFAVVPDEVGDAKATNALWCQWAGKVWDLGYRTAYVAQDGCSWVPFHADVLFIGGSTEWKLGAEARRLIAGWQERGRWVHVGRVNTRGRLRYTDLLGVDSVDGTKAAFGPDVNLPELLAWLHPANPPLFGGVA